MKKVLITGGNGQLGHSLNRILKDTEVISTDFDTLDICDEKQVDAFIKEHMPDTIINCAAHTAVDKCETDYDNALHINADGPANLARAAESVGAVMVQVSTDYVFDGDTDRAYVESDKTNPQSVYGKTKLMGEENVIKYCNRYFIVRTAWLYGEGNNFVKTMLRLSESRDKITVVTDQFGTPTSSDELARMILHIIPEEKYGIYHGTCEGQTSWFEFAKRIMELTGRTTEIIPVTTEEYGATVAKRPKYSVLENAKLNSMGEYRMKNWEDALEEYIEKFIK